MEPDKFVDLFRKFLRSHGLNITKARELVAKEAFQTENHFDASQLWARLRGEKIAAATIYRTLELLTQAGLVRKLLFNDKTCYEANLGRPHHEHLVCQGCSRVVEFSDPLLEERLAEIVEAHGFRPHSHQVMILGLCPACQHQTSGLGGPEA